MNWIKQNTFLAGLLAVLLIGAAALGYLFWEAKKGYAEAQGDLRLAFEGKRKVERQAPYPSEENAEEVSRLIEDVGTQADSLRSAMFAAQAMMPRGVRATRFQADLSQKVAAVIEAAEPAGVTLPDGFYLSMDDYKVQLPLREAVDRLQFQLDAIVQLTDLLFAHGVTEFDIKRVRMPFEKGNGEGEERPGQEELPVSEVYPMEVVFEMSERGFQRVLNALSNTARAVAQEDEANLAEGEPAEDYFFVTRWMRVENEKLEGPEKAEDELEDAINGEEAAADVAKDLKMIFGREKVRVYLALDLVRFINPRIVAAN